MMDLQKNHVDKLEYYENTNDITSAISREKYLKMGQGLES